MNSIKKKGNELTYRQFISGSAHALNLIAYQWKQAIYTWRNVEVMCLWTHVPNFHSYGSAASSRESQDPNLCRSNIIFNDELMMSKYRFIQEELRASSYNYQILCIYCSISQKDNISYVWKHGYYIQKFITQSFCPSIVWKQFQLLYRFKWAQHLAIPFRFCM